jgi:hypothetical protein
MMRSTSWRACRGASAWLHGMRAWHSFGGRMHDWETWVVCSRVVGWGGGMRVRLRPFLRGAAVRDCPAGPCAAGAPGRSGRVSKACRRRRRRCRPISRAWRRRSPARHSHSMAQSHPHPHFLAADRVISPGRRVGADARTARCAAAAARRSCVPGTAGTRRRTRAQRAAG